MRVAQLSGNQQQPEGRFAGTLGDAELVNCSTHDVATMLKPDPDSEPADAEVIPNDIVSFRVLLPDLYATVLVCAAGNHICYNQNGNFAPLPTRRRQTTTLKVHYGAPDLFHVWIALTSDPAFLRNEQQLSSDVAALRAERTVYWLGPAEVTRNFRINKERRAR